MCSSKAWSYVTVLLLCSSWSSLVLGASDSITDPVEVTALRAIKKSLVDVNKNLSNWNSGDPCTSNWVGVLCYNDTLDDGYLHVRELQLLNMNLSGTLSPELGRLSHMKILDFIWNHITGSIPKEIGNITTLELLLLNGNNLTGSLPDELGYLPNLDRIQIDQNQISGPLPKSFANLNKTKHFHMNNNSISGQIPPELARLPSLVYFLLDNNNLSGYLPPELYQMPSLEILQLDNNNFEGTTIPSTYSNMSKLFKLSLRNCNLQGPIPDLGTIPQLGYLDLSLNRLNGSIPGNKLSSNITTINLSNNSLVGPIPSNFSDLPLLQNLLIANNSLNDSVPSTLWQGRTLNATQRLIFDFENNQLSNISDSSVLPQNVSVWLKGNPLCSNTNLVQFCGSQGENEIDQGSNSTLDCAPQACQAPYEYSRTSPVRCFCAVPLLVNYRLKSPGISYFLSYKETFEKYLTDGLKLQLYQLDLNYFAWEKGPRLRMHFRLYPVYEANTTNTNVFNDSEVRRITSMFTAWSIPDNDVFGPYELLGFDHLGPYRDVFDTDFKSPSQKEKTGLIVGIVVGVGVILLLLLAVVFIVHRRKRPEADVDDELLGMDVKPYTFSYDEIKTATEGFILANKLGEGGFGPVYKGTLSDGRVIAVKQLSVASHQGKSQFVAEIATLSSMQHRNLVTLHGCCYEKAQRILIYEYLEHGSLDKALFGKGGLNLDWSVRYDICLGVARGLTYLHEESRLRIIHRDVKASNILLDSNLIPKISDFGLAKLYDDEKTHISTRVAGTLGYLAPEYAMRGYLTEKTDVFAFGVVALEVVSGRPNWDSSLEEEKMYLLDWAWHLYKNKRQLELVDSKLSEFNEEQVKGLIGVAHLCIQTLPSSRPSMSRVIAMLCGDIEVSTITSKPGYLTERAFDDLTTFISDDTIEECDDTITSHYISSTRLHPMDKTSASEALLH